MKILMILPRFPYPLEKGDKLRAFHQIKTLSKDHEIHVFCIAASKPEKEDINILKQYTQSISLYIPTKREIFFNLIKNTLKGKPWQFSFFVFSKAKKHLKNYIRKVQPDHLFCQLIRTAEYAESFNMPKTLDYQDAFSLGMQRRAKLSKYPKKLVFLREYKKLKYFETFYFDHFDYKIIISENDRKAINHPKKEDIIIVKNGIDTDFFSPDRNVKKDFDLLFVGHLAYPPNVEAALFLAENITPLLLKKYPNIKILIAGANPTKEIKRLRNANIEIKASLKDIREAYNQARLFVAPMFLGSGLQNKLLEAMSMELPCITTELPNQTLQAEKDKDLLIAQTEEEFVNQIDNLIQNKILFDQLQKNGRVFVESHFSWDNEMHKWLNRIV